VVLILGIVLPRFRMLFADSGLTPPLHLELLFTASTLVETHWPVLGAIVAVSVLAAVYWLRVQGGRERLARLSRGLPLVGPIVVLSDIGRFSRCLGTLLGAAVALPDAAKLAAAVPNNPAIAEDLAPLAQRLREGRDLSSLLRSIAVVPPMVPELVAIGETTGDLAGTLTRAAGLLEQEAEHRSERLLALLVPAITVALGLGVAAMIGSVVGVLIELNALAG
jgi:type II secretory pathway component PulF